MIKQNECGFDLKQALIRLENWRDLTHSQWDGEDVMELRQYYRGECKAFEIAIDIVKDCVVEDDDICDT